MDWQGSDDSDSVAHLLNKAVARDDDARAELIERYRGTIRSEARFSLQPAVRRRVDDSDIVQITCLEAHRSFDRFRGRTRGEFHGWLRGIMRFVSRQTQRWHSQECRDVYCEYAGDSEALVEASDHTVSPLDKLIVAERQQHLTELIDRLPEKYAQAVRLRYLRHMRLEDIATEMGVSLAAVAGYLRRALEQLEQEIQADSSHYSL